MIFKNQRKHIFAFIFATITFILIFQMSCAAASYDFSSKADMDKSIVRNDSVIESGENTENDIPDDTMDISKNIVNDAGGTNDDTSSTVSDSYDTTAEASSSDFAESDSMNTVWGIIIVILIIAAIVLLLFAFIPKK